MAFSVEDISEAQKFMESYENIVVYGAGVVGQICINWLVKSGVAIEKLCFAVSKKGDVCDLMGIPIKEISDFKGMDNTLIILATKENLHHEMIEVLNKNQIQNYIVITNQLYQKLYAFDYAFGRLCESIVMGEGRKNQIRNDLSQIQNEIFDMNNYFARKMQRTILNFEIHVAEHCNLNCKNCDHFSPLAKEEYVNLGQLKKDYMRLNELTQGNVGHIKLLGGEPLLHPELNQVMRLTRTYFKNAYITLVSNGILLNQQGEEFWATCRENRIHIAVTKYPIKLDFEGISKKALDQEVSFSYFNNSQELKTSWHLPLDLSGSQDSSKNFVKCWRPNDCIILSKGKIYGCVVPANVHHFNSYFNKEVTVSNKDYLDIYEVSSVEEIFKFLCSPIPFCRYCNVNCETKGHPWGISKREIEEWT